MGGGGAPFVLGPSEMLGWGGAGIGVGGAGK